jgi:predicted ribosome quality control (RQC) complex YloA/Tae2 family protein
LSSDDNRILNHCYSDLKKVVKELSGADRQYFARLQNIAGLIIEKLKERRTMPDKESFKPEWEKNFLKIREILNDWDPSGVADSVDDEYDTMNFRTLSVLMNKRDKNEIKEILADYTKNSMELTVDNVTLDRVSEQISKIRLE